MFSEHTLKHSLRYLYRGAVHEYGCNEKDANALLEQLDFRKLASAFRQKARRVYAFEALKDGVSPPEFRGRDLFGQWAVRVYHKNNKPANDKFPMLSIDWEVWMMEDGNLRTVSCILNKDSVEPLETRFREVCGYPFGCELNLNLDETTKQLRKMYVAEQAAPPYLAA